MKINSPLYYIKFDPERRTCTTDHVGFIKVPKGEVIQLCPHPENRGSQEQWYQLVEMLVEQAKKLAGLGIQRDFFLFPAHVVGEIAFVECNVVLHVGDIRTWGDDIPFAPFQFEREELERIHNKFSST